MKFILPFLLALAASGALAQPKRVAVIPILVTDPCKSAGDDIERTRGILNQAAMEYLDKAFFASDIVLIDADKVRFTLEDAKLDFRKASDRKPDKLEDLGKKLEASHVLLVQVDKTEQKNADPAAAAANPNIAKSRSRVRVRVWLLNVADNRLELDGAKNEFNGEYRGGFLGTTNPRELSGDPTSKGIVLNSEYKKRARYLGQALVEAIKLALTPALDLEEPPN